MSVCLRQMQRIQVCDVSLHQKCNTVPRLVFLLDVVAIVRALPRLSPFSHWEPAEHRTRCDVDPLSQKDSATFSFLGLRSTERRSHREADVGSWNVTENTVSRVLSVCHPVMRRKEV